HSRQPPLTFDAGTLPRRADKDQGMEKMARTVARSMAHSAEVTTRIAPMNTAEKSRPSVPERLVILAVFACMPRPHKGERLIVAPPGYAFVTFLEMFFGTGAISALQFRRKRRRTGIVMGSDKRDGQEIGEKADCKRGP